MGGDFHSRTALGMYDHIKEAIAKGECPGQQHGQPWVASKRLWNAACTSRCSHGRQLRAAAAQLPAPAASPPTPAEQCLLEWEGEGEPPLPLLKDMFASERRKAKVGHRQRRLEAARRAARRAGPCSACVPCLAARACRRLRPGADAAQRDRPRPAYAAWVPHPAPSLFSPCQVLNFSIAYGKTAHGLSKDWKVTIQEAEDTVKRWYESRPEVGAGAGGAAATPGKRWPCRRRLWPLLGGAVAGGQLRGTASSQAPPSVALERNWACLHERAAPAGAEVAEGAA